MVEFVTNRQWDSYARRIEKANVRKYGHSITQSGIASRANKLIVDIQSDKNGMLVQIGWKDLMKQEAK